jgi:hypothetical protein
MKRLRLVAVAVMVLVLTPAVAWSGPKGKCPKRPVVPDSPCTAKNTFCNFRCQAEGDRDLLCSCQKDEAGSWRWQCTPGPVCTM